jgi:hypothetical protein
MTVSNFLLRLKIVKWYVCAYRVKMLLQDKFSTFINYVVHSKYIPRGVKKGLDTKNFERCVSKVKGRSGKSATPYAVCNATDEWQK